MTHDSPFLSRDVLERIENMAVDILINLEDELVQRLIDSKGLTYGDLDLPQQERLLKYADDEQMGVNSWMRQNEPEEYQKRTRQFVRDAEQGGVL